MKLQFNKIVYSTILLLSISFLMHAQTSDEQQVLLPNQPIEREMTGAETHKYIFNLQKDEFFQVRVEQKGVDVQLKLLDDDGKSLATMDSSNGNKGYKNLSFVAVKADNFILQVIGCCEKLEKGIYNIIRVQPRIASESEKQSEANKLYYEAEDLSREGTKNSIYSSIIKLNQACQLFQGLNDKRKEISCLSNLADNYKKLGELKIANELYEKALLINQSLSDKDVEANLLSQLGYIYSDLGEDQIALRFYKQALELYKQSENLTLEKAILNLIQSLDEKLKAQRKLEESKKELELIQKKYNKENKSTKNQATSEKMDDPYKNSLYPFYRQELEILLKLLPLEKKLSGFYGEAEVLTNIGEVYLELNENSNALKYFEQALLFHKISGNKSGEANTLYFLMIAHSFVKNESFAVFYGKQSVNKYQKLRQIVQGFDKNIQASYLKKIEPAYRIFANILISQGRIAEAEQVLGMLKEDEYFAYLRRDDKVASELKSRISLSEDEKKAFEEYEKFADEITRAAQEFEALKKKIPFGGTTSSLSADEQKRYRELENQYNSAVTVFNKFLDDLKIKFGKTDVRVEKIESDTIGLLKSLNQPRTVIISTIVGEDRLNLIVTTSEVQRAHTVEVKAADLNKLVAEFRQALINPAIDPRPAGKRLYDLLFPAALQKDLANINAETIVWSLDGTLRYVPMSALWDGEKYLVERYSSAIITLASRDKLASTGSIDRRNWTAFGVGVSKQFENFDALPAVPKELCGVVKDAKKSEFCGKLGETGVFGGLMLRDEEFTLDVFQPNLGKTPLVHIASHFALNPGEYDASFLLLGGGANRRFSLKNLRETRLDGIELLTLSACNTAMTSGNQTNGLEVEGFGALAQKQGVKSVLATLWSVADDSTGTMMTEFYRQMQTDTQIGKAEALRQVQIKMITGKLKPSNANSGCRSGVYKLEGKTETPYKCDTNAPFSHPFFWSPFILFGNWK